MLYNFDLNCHPGLQQYRFSDCLIFNFFMFKRPDLYLPVQHLKGFIIFNKNFLSLNTIFKRLRNKIFDSKGKFQYISSIEN